MKPINIDKLRTQYQVSDTGIVYSNWRNTSVQFSWLHDGIPDRHRQEQ